MTVHDRCCEIYVSEGSNDVVGVNRYLKEKYPDPKARVRAIEELEESGPWDILWHESSRVPGHVRDHGIVMAYLG